MHERLGTRSHVAGTLPVQVPRPLALPGLADQLLALQQTHGNQAVQRLIAGAAPAAPVLQRQIRITPDDYASALGVAPAAMSAEQLREYARMAVLDELAFVKQHAMAKGPYEPIEQWEQLVKDAGSARKSAAERVQAVRDLVTSINAFEAQHMTGSAANKDTRYASEPKGGYQHSGKAAWRDDRVMWEAFGASFGPEHAQLATTDPKGHGLQPLPQLPWATAKRLLPRPLLNLIFDVRMQLESGGATVIDERTASQQERRDKSPREPGTLRSWHQDSVGVLPATGFKAPPPAHGRALHDHYATASQTGAGSSIGEGTKTPTGLAEYTGTGSNWEHNTKVVLDYVGKRVYLTLTHYQYWALVDRGGTPEFWNSETQELVQAQGRLETHLEKESLTPDKATLMSPWMEVLVT